MLFNLVCNFRFAGSLLHPEAKAAMEIYKSMERRQCRCTDNKSWLNRKKMTHNCSL